MTSTHRAQCLLVVGAFALWGCKPATVTNDGQGGKGGGNSAGGTSGGGGKGGGAGQGGSTTSSAGGQAGGGSGDKGGSAGSGGSGGSTSGSGGAGGGTSGSGGSGGGAGGSSGKGGSSGSTGGSGAGGTSAAPACKADLTNLVTPTGWICAADTEVKIQGAFYMYDDGASCTKADNPCSANGCCISGTTVVDATYAKWGCGVGMELSSSGGTSPTKSVYSGPVSCFNIELSGDSGGNEVRIGFTQSSDNTGKVSPYVPVAAFKNGWKGQVCLTDAECPDWATKAGTCSKTVGTAGTPFDLQVQVSAGSASTSVGLYNVCVTKVQPVTSGGSGTGGSGGGGGTSSCSSSTGQGTLSGQYDTAHVTCSGQDYIVQNNAWGSTAGQTISYGPGTKFEVTVQKANLAGTGSPASYPSLFIGANDSRSTSNSGLPKAISSLGSVQTSWSWTGGAAADTFNAAYDVWFSTSASGDPSSASPSGGYLMVWYHKPTGATPIGTSKETATIAGKSWNVYFGNNSGNNKPCVSFVAQQSLDSFSYNLKDFIDYAVKNNYGLQSSWSLTNVFAGFEIWSGGVGLKTTDFSVTVK